MPTPPLELLATELPRPQPARRAALFEGADPQSFAEVGRRVASSRVITDTSTLYGEAAAFWKGASGELRDLLVGFSTELLAEAVHLALELERDLRIFESRSKADAVARETSATALGAVWTTSLRRRNLGGRTLATVAGADPTRKALLASVIGTAKTPDELGRGLRDLAALGRTWMADPLLAPQVALARLTPAWADALDRAAAELQRAATAARTRASADVTQGSLDDLDGRNLFVLDLIVDLFDEGHALDPRIPRLIPNATATVFGRRDAAPSDETLDAPSATPPVADATATPSS